MIERKVEWHRMRREELVQAARERAMVILPVGSMEQHGLHLPVNTDTATAWHIAVSAAQMLEDMPIVVAPPVWSGLSPHHMKYGGTISLRLETFTNLISDICSSIVAHGFGSIVLLNGHGGNRGLLEALAVDLRYRLEVPVLAITYWDLISEELEAVREGRGKGIGHSGEMETSIQLFLQKDLVAVDQLELVPGVTDDPALGRPEKGERLMKVASERLAKRLRALVGEFKNWPDNPFALPIG